MKTIKILIYMFIAFLLAGCNFENTKPKTAVQEKKYIPNITWTLQTDASWSLWQITYDRFVYFEEEDPIEGYHYAKVDMETGEYVWKSDAYEIETVFQPAITEKYLCFFDYSEILHIYDNNTGKELATVYVKENPNEVISSGNNLTVIGNYLYWGNFVKGKNYGLVRINIDDIDFNTTKPQTIIPECLWKSSGKGIVNSFVMEKEVLYFLNVNSEWQDETTSAYLVAWDIVNEKVIWQTGLNSIFAYSYNSVKLVDNRIFIFDDGIYVCDKNTGEILYRKIQTREDLMHEINISAPNYLAGIYYEDGLFYYTRVSYPGSNETMGFPEEYNRNIICYDANKYKIAWSDIPPYKDGGSLMTRPVVVKGKCFVVTSSGLRVYEAKSGKFLGVWRDIYNFGWDYNASYEDKFIFFNHDRETGKGILTAITVD